MRLEVTEPVRSAASGAAGFARARVAFRQDGGATRLEHLVQQAPLRVLFPRPATAGVPEAVLVNTAGGIVAGDRLQVEGALGTGGQALLTSQAAEKVYRSDGRTAEILVGLEAGAGARLACLPPVLIVRWLGEDAAAVRTALHAFCAAFGRKLGGLPAACPRLWRQ